MKILSSYKEALKEAEDYMSSEDSVKNTLQYIFDEHYSCYMLCVKDSNYELYKLQSKSGNPLIDKKINKTIKQKKIKSSTKTWRIMQCIVKPFKKESTFATEWIEFLDSVKKDLPNGVFILSLSDSLLLPTTKEGKFLPCFAYSGKVGYKDIPIPTYDDIFDNEVGLVDTEWTNKKAVAVFRGSSTGCGTTVETNMRLKLATMRSDDLDVGITKYTENLKLDSKKGLSKTEKVVPLSPSLSWNDQSKYKYIIHIDGNVLAYRLLKSMLTGSLILRVKSDYVHWLDGVMKPNKHYIEVKPDLSDLQEVLEWCKKHDADCKKIAKRSFDFATKVLSSKYIQSSFVNILKKA